MAYPHQLSKLESDFPKLLPGELKSDSSEDGDGIGRRFYTPATADSDATSASPPLSGYGSTKVSRHGSVDTSMLIGPQDDEDSDADGETKKTKYRLEETRKRVERLTERVRQSIQMIMERGDKVDDLNERAYNLLQESFQFKQVTQSLRKKFWAQNRRLFFGLMIGLIVFVLLLVYLLLPARRRPF